MSKHRILAAIAILAIGGVLLAALYPRTVILDLIAERARTARVKVETVSIGGTRLPAIVVGKRKRVSIEAVPVFPGAILTVSIGVREDVWDLDGDGVLFQIFAKEGDERTFLFSRYIDPKSRPEHRRWITVDIPLAEKLQVGYGLPSRVGLVLKTSAGFRGNKRNDAAVWANLKVEKPGLSWPSFLRKRPPNVLLLSLDTLRADHVGAFGYHRNTTPSIDRIASGGIRFSRAYAPANHTLESHMSVLTGLYPIAHGVRPGSGKRREIGVAPLSANRVTLAETLQARGYVTGGFAYDCVWLNRKHGFGQGFEEYVVSRRDSAAMNDHEIFPWLDAHYNEPFFLFVHYYDIHSDWEKLPYDAPDRFKSKYQKSYSGTFDGCGGGVCATRYLMRLDTKDRPFAEPELAYVRSLYDAGVEATDFQVGRLVDKLEALGVLDDTLVVVMSDHGEEFRDHGRFIHSQIYEEIVRVPLIFRWPSVIGAMGESLDPVALVDVMPTILDLLGIAPEAPIQGRSLYPYIRNRVIPPTPIYLVGRGLDGVVQWPWKLIVQGKGGSSLYNLEEDPNETVDKSEVHPRKFRELRRMLLTWKNDTSRFQEGQRSAESVVEPSEKDLDRLEALGYGS